MLEQWLKDIKLIQQLRYFNRITTKKKPKQSFSTLRPGFQVQANVVLPEKACELPSIENVM